MADYKTVAQANKFYLFSAVGALFSGGFSIWMAYDKREAGFLFIAFFLLAFAAVVFYEFIRKSRLTDEERRDEYIDTMRGI